MAEELTGAEEEQLSAALAELEVELEESLVRGKAAAAPVDLDQPIGRLSRMDAMQQQAMASANKRTAEIRLRLIKAARTALDRGDYGLCRRCEEPIGFQRLSAKPETPFCMPCQRSSEAKS